MVNTIAKPRVLDDAQLRYLAIRLMSLPSKRTLQKNVGASDIADPCDRCLAYALGKKLDIKQRALTPQAMKVWMGAEIGTGIHGHMEERLNFTHDDSLTHAERALVAEVYGLTPGAIAETHVTFGHIKGYGDVGGTIDLDLAGQIADWKGSTRKKTALLIDFMAIQRGKEPVYGRTHTAVKLSEKQYAEEMAKMASKMERYYGQQSLYLLGRELEGRPVDRGSIIWINRDGTGYFDVPDQAGYDDPSKMHDIWPLTFAYNRDFALGLLERAQYLWDQVSAGVHPREMDAHEHCWTCSMAEKDAEKRVESMNLDAPVRIGIETKEAA